MVQQYLDHSKEILSSDITDFKDNKRTGMGHISIFGYQNRYELGEGFPLLTTKKLPFKAIAHELIWFLNGQTNIKYLADNNVHIWDDNAFDYNLEKMAKEGVFSSGIIKHSEDWFKAKDEYIQRIKEDSGFANKWGDLGPVYGSQWIHWPKYIPVDVKVEGIEQQLYIKDSNGIDQIATTIKNIQKNPTAKRHLISAWNPDEVSNMALPPCHTMFHINVNEGKMDLQLYQRSCDMFLGVPFNIASYAMLTQILAQQLDLEPRRFVHTFGDVHFYCGAGERKEWYKKNLEELKARVKTSDYQSTLDWVNSNVPPEQKGKEGQDHVTGILEQMTRTPKKLPKLIIAKKPYNELTIDDFKIDGYDAYPTIKRAIAV